MTAAANSAPAQNRERVATGTGRLRNGNPPGDLRLAGLLSAHPGRASRLPAGDEKPPLPAAWQQIDRAAQRGRSGTEPAGARGPWRARPGV